MLNGFQLSTRAIVAWLLAVIMLTGTAIATVNMGVGVYNNWNQRHAMMTLDTTSQRFRSLGRNATAVFTPVVDVHGAANCTGVTPPGAVNPWCHEIDFYALDGSGTRHFQAYIFESGGLQEYTYSDPQLFAGKAPTNPVKIGQPAPMSYFQVRAIPLTSLTTDPGASAITQALIAQDGLQPKLQNYSVQTAFSGVKITNAVYHAEFGNAYWKTSVETGVGAMPVVGVVLNVGTFTPTPAPLFAITGASLLFNWPAAPQQTFTVKEANYHDWYGVSTGWNCGAQATFPAGVPYSGAAYSGVNANNPAAPPVNEPYSYPNPNNAANQNASATFRINPAAAGQCNSTIANTYGQTASEAVRVMGWLTLQSGAKTATSQTAALVVQYAGFKNKGDSTSFTAFKTYDNDVAGLKPTVALDATCSQYLTASAPTGAAQASPTGTESATITLTMFKIYSGAVAINCGGTVGDQYGEPVASFKVIVDPGIPACDIVAPVAESVGVNAALRTSAFSAGQSNITLKPASPAVEYQGTFDPAIPGEEGTVTYYFAEGLDTNGCSVAILVLTQNPDWLEFSQSIGNEDFMIDMTAVGGGVEKNIGANPGLTATGVAVFNPGWGNGSGFGCPSPNAMQTTPVGNQGADWGPYVIVSNTCIPGNGWVNYQNVPGSDYLGVTSGIRQFGDNMAAGGLWAPANTGSITSPSFPANYKIIQSRTFDTVWYNGAWSPRFVWYPSQTTTSITIQQVESIMATDRAYNLGSGWVRQNTTAIGAKLNL